MKPMFESEETFEAYAAIDYCYYRIEQIGAEMNKPQPTINAMIDKATGYEAKRQKDWTDETVELLKTVVECKKKIEADYRGDLEMLDKLKELKVK